MGIGTGFSARSTNGAVERVLQTCDPVKTAEAEQMIHEVQMARNEALRVVENDEHFDKPEYAMLWQRLKEMKKATIDWASIS